MPQNDMVGKRHGNGRGEKLLEGYERKWRMERVRIIAATRNKHKIEEIEAITKKFGMFIVPRDEAGVPEVEIEEDGETFEENSYKKAFGIMELCGEITIADDSGLCVDILDGAPGVYSARFAGEPADDGKNNQKLLDLLKDIPFEKRGAKFVSVITMVYPDGKRIAARGECRGHIAFEERGEKGFGYDSVFVPLGRTETFGEIPSEEKNRMSHRAFALMELERLLSCQKRGC